MILIGRNVLDEFCIGHADARKQIEVWRNEVEDAKWISPNDIKERYPNASILKDNIIIFNIKGNDYRLAAKISFENEIVLVTKVGTHAEYNKWNL